MIKAYWEIGRRIVDEELHGKKRAVYGENFLAGLSHRLTKEFGKGFTETNLKYFKQFYLNFSIYRDDREADGAQSAMQDQKKSHALRDELTWTHYRLLLKIENEEARTYYMHEAAAQNWSTRTLDRQISSLYYERLLSSKDRNQLACAIEKETESDKPTIRDFVKDPYILEFLALDSNATLFEKELETELLNKLQLFLLELGKGFSFVARQKRITAENEHFFIDLVFYNYLLKCFVLLDLKAGKLSHQDIGQMDLYVRYYEDQVKQDSDNPTIGIILCTEKNETIVKYSILKESKQLFASKYKLYLPTERELIEELNSELKELEAKSR
jgi:predicted nuclease of restriction endonuclease-like (RecB) superfamily